MATTEERLSKLEGAYEHLATKADVAVLKTDIADLKADLFNKMNVHLRWMIGIQVAVLIGVAAIMRLFQ